MTLENLWQAVIAGRYMRQYQKKFFWPWQRYEIAIKKSLEKDFDMAVQKAIDNIAKDILK